MATLNQVIKGLEILVKYSGDGSHSICAEHDIIYAGPDVKEDLRDEDRKALEELGWHWAEDADSWARFV
jgi:hypothetical protein